MTVTMMPDVATQMRTPRVVGVEFPFGHAFGMVGDRDMQFRVARAAVDLIDTAATPGTRVDLDIEWPQDPKQAYKEWQPPMPSPIVQVFLDRLAESRAAAREASEGRRTGD